MINKPVVFVVNGREYRSDTGFFHTGVKKTYTVRTKEGYEFSATENHKVMRKGGRYVEVSWLQVGDELELHNHEDVTWEGKGSCEEGWLVGNFVGDGCFSNNKALLCYWGEDRNDVALFAKNLMDSCLSLRSDAHGHESKCHDKTIFSSTDLKSRMETLVSPGKILLPEIETYSAEFYKGFLRGWFDAYGCVLMNEEKGRSVRLSSSTMSHLQMVQRMLIRLGIYSKIYRNRRAEQYRDLPDGKGGLKSYLCKAQHELVVSRDQIVIFRNRIGFSNPRKASLKTQFCF